MKFGKKLSSRKPPDLFENFGTMAENERNTKNSDVSSKNVVKFERTLTLYGGIALTVGTMIGSGQG